MPRPPVRTMAFLNRELSLNHCLRNIDARMVYEDINLNESADSLHMAVVVSRYHDTITTTLRRGAIDAFADAGGAENNLLIIDAPGTFELPTLCGELTRYQFKNAPLDGIIALGCVITGDTMHDQYINAAVSHTLAHLAATTGIPIAFGVLTCATIEQAHDRAGGCKGNKGADAMRATITTARTLQRLRATKELN